MYAVYIIPQIQRKIGEIVVEYNQLIHAINGSQTTCVDKTLLF